MNTLIKLSNTERLESASSDHVHYYCTWRESNETDDDDDAN